MWQWPASRPSSRHGPSCPAGQHSRSCSCSSGAGSQSEPEIRGLRGVLTVPGLPAPRLQYRVHLPGGPVRPDAAWPELKIAVEFDGAAFHGSPNARERDLRRDAALGWVVLRFDYRDVTRHPEVCRARIAATYRQRPSAAPGRGIPPAGMPRPGASPGA